ncbi:hypothetical protein CP533_2654 [Ophiocordyceps camponoti-saundersi (nom. inval.)]|nr:hypothetical protein CP533_2654 [Ophiocordyceps camponoti-saundersi (nom. inval.)]
MTGLDLDRCFVPDTKPLTEPIRILDVGDDGAFSTRDLLTIEDVNGCFSEAQGWKSRFISICQRNSWQPLQATRSMLESVADSYQLRDSFWELVSCFYARNSDLEEAFTVPLARFVGSGCVDIAYSLRYPEYKATDNEWALRQSALYHRLDLSSRQSLFILFSPRPEARAHMHTVVEKHLRLIPNDDFGLHQVFFSTYIPNWRRYIAAQERRFLPVSKTTFATFIDEPLRVSYDSLSEIASLQIRFLTTATTLSAAQQLLSDLSSLLREEPLDSKAEAEQLDNHARRCVAYARAAAHLGRQAQTTAQLLTATLSLHDQVIAKEQNGNMLKLNKSAVFVTTLTLVYAPASFVASFFGMNFFAMDQTNNRIVATSMIWIYIVSILAFTAATVAFYYWLIQHDDVLFWRLAPKVRYAPDWKSLARRLTAKTSPPQGMELQPGMSV